MIEGALTKFIMYSVQQKTPGSPRKVNAARGGVKCSNSALTMDEETEVIEVDNSIQSIPEEVTSQTQARPVGRMFDIGKRQVIELTRTPQRQSCPPGRPIHRAYQP